MRPGAAQVTHQDGVVVARLQGDIDLLGVPTITAHLRDAAATSPLGLVVDLGEVRYLDSAGVQMLFQLARELTLTRKGLAVTLPPQAPITMLLRVTGFDQAVTVHPSVDTCVAAVCRGEYLQY